MTDQGPYREAPKFLLCPRCGELLDRAFDDVLVCMRCEGVFITPPTAGLAFGDPAWPKDAAAMWWKSSLACPVCAYAGAVTTMAAQSCEGMQIDRCTAHGLWLDRGELGRLMRTTSHELEELRRKLHGDEPDLEKLHEKREAWRRDVEARRRAAEAQNAKLAEDRRRLIEEAEHRERVEQAAAERTKRDLDARAPISRVRLPPTIPPEPGAETWRERQESERIQRIERKQVETERARVVREIGELESQLTALRMQVRVVETELSAHRAKLRALADD